MYNQGGFNGQPGFNGQAGFNGQQGFSGQTGGFINIAQQGQGYGQQGYGQQGYGQQGYGQQGFGGQGSFGGHSSHHGHGHGHHHHGGFNRWGNANSNYQQMNGFTSVDYSNGWNANSHDQLLRNNIEIVYQKFDANHSGQLEGNEFYNAYSELCLRMGLAPPQSYQQVFNAAQACDSNNDGRVSKNEMFMLFKRIQGIQGGGQGLGINGVGVNINLGGGW